MENMKRRVLDRMTCVLPPGHYDTPHKLIRTLNTCILSKVVQLWAQTENVGFHYSDTGNKVIFETMRLKLPAMDRGWYNVDARPSVSQPFHGSGFRRKRNVRGNRTQASVSVDMVGGFKNIYINADIVKSTHCVSHILQRLLRVVPIASKKRNEMILYKLVNINWFPLCFN